MHSRILIILCPNILSILFYSIQDDDWDAGASDEDDGSDDEVDVSDEEDSYYSKNRRVSKDIKGDILPNLVKSIKLHPHINDRIEGKHF